MRVPAASRPHPVIAFLFAPYQLLQLRSSSTSVTCASSSAGGGGSLASLVALTVGGVVGSLLQTLTFDTATVSFVMPRNLPSSAPTSITVTGLSFGIVDYSSTVATGAIGFGCPTSSWSSSTSISCRLSATDGPDIQAFLTVANRVGTLLNAFSFDGRRCLVTCPTGFALSFMSGPMRAVSCSAGFVDERASEYGQINVGVVNGEWSSVRQLRDFGYSPLGCK